MKRGKPPPTTKNTKSASRYTKEPGGPGHLVVRILVYLGWVFVSFVVGGLQGSTAPRRGLPPTFLYPLRQSPTTMTRGVRWTAVALGLLLAVSISGAVQSATQPKWRGTLEAGLPAGANETMCDPYDHCDELHGVTVATIDVSDVMEDRNETADYVLKDLSSYVSLTTWRMCMYDDAGELIECHQEGYSWYLWGELPADTREVRIILVNNAAVYYQLRLAI